MHTERITFTFAENNKVLVDIKDSNSMRDVAPGIEGVIQ
jgi:hypothetical protein